MRKRVRGTEGGRWGEREGFWGVQQELVGRLHFTRINSSWRVGFSSCEIRYAVWLWCRVDSGKRNSPPTSSKLPHPKKKRKFNYGDVLFKKRLYGNSKGTDFFFFTESGCGSPDIGKRHFNKAVARNFSIPHHPPQGGGMQAFAISQIQGLFSLPSKSTFYTSCHVGTLDPLEATCTPTNNLGLRSLEKYKIAGKQWEKMDLLWFNNKYEQTFFEGFEFS